MKEATMFFVLTARAAVGAALSLRRGIHSLRVATDIWVAAKKGEKKQVMNVPVYVTREEFFAIVTKPEVWKAREQALKAQSLGLIDVCPTCDQAFQNCA
jgi:hypothetical protein